ncbi:hypothetical protein QP835_11480 [Pseudomonas oryzihabitans]|uniref:hypothetical protein n=1 Tax=Pseudomonas oryzihabitans TaxID=47885 RepID=UPI0025545626|nr:hypothetical protein [Pseudomonas oryzihabitans]MDK8264897.1 hypothetical protein [Pseudomonas oryzihabitans]
MKPIPMKRESYVVRNWPWLGLLLLVLFICTFGWFTRGLDPAPVVEVHPGWYGFVVAELLGLCALEARATDTASARVISRLAGCGAGVAIVWMCFFAG